MALIRIVQLAILIHLVLLTAAKPLWADDLDIHLSDDEKRWLEQQHIVHVRGGNWPPFLMEKKGFEGIALDYIRAIFDRNGIKYKFVSSAQYSWKTSLEYVKSHQVFDLIPTAKITEERKKYFVFTDEYLQLPWVVFTRNDAEFIGRLDDLSGKSVCVPEGYVMDGLLSDQYPEIHLQRITGDSLVPRCMQELALGNVDAYIGNLAVGSYIMQDKGYANLKVAAPTPFGNHDQAMLIRNDWPELANIINKTLKTFTPAEHAAIRNKWLSVRYEHGISLFDVIQWGTLSLLLASIIGGTIILWNRRLIREIKERKRIENELLINERRYKSAQRMGLVGNWEYDLVTETFWGSDQAKLIYGYDPGSDRFTIDEVENCIPEREHVHQALIDLIEKGTPYNLEFDIHPISGNETRKIQSIAEIQRDKTGAPLKIVGVIQDITERRLNELALEESEKKFRQLTDISPGAIYQTNVKGDCVYANKAWLKMTDMSIEEVQGKGWIKGLHPDDREKVSQSWYKMANSKGEWGLEYRLQDSQGKITLVYGLAAPIEESNGEITGYLSINVDITQLKRYEKEIKRQRDLFELIVNTVPARIFWKDLDLVYVGCNARFAKDSGMEKPEDVVGKTDYNLVWKKDAEVYRTDDRLVINTGKAKIKYEEPFLNKEGKQITWLTSKMPLKNADGEIIGVIAISENITEQKKAEELEQKVERQLQQAQKMEAIGTLAGGIAHDFNNIISVIAGNISLALPQFNKGEELYDALVDIKDGTKQAKKLTQQLLTFAKGGEPIKEVIQLNPLINESSGFVLRGSKSKYEYNQPADLWNVKADSSQLYQVISNIVINADQAMPDGGKITIQSENIIIDTDNSLNLSSGKYVKISIEDQGVGIHKNYISKVFDPYYTTKQKGSGLGLATSYSVIKKHGGQLTVYSEVTKGTAFHIYLPATEQSTVESNQSIISEHFGKGKILIMDDQEPILRMAGRMLTKMGYETVFAMNGVEATDKYRESYNIGNPFDLVILDLTIPGGMGGAKTIIELLKIDKNVKAIVSSGYNNDTIMANYEDYGFCGVVPKPYTKSQLSQILNKILGNSP